MRTKATTWTLLALHLCGLFALVLSTGCISETRRKTPTISEPIKGDTIQEINLMAMPVALNMDNTPGPDGFLVKVYAGSRDRPKPFPIEDGQLEVLMFDGIPGVTEGAPPQPRRRWTFSAEQLKQFEVTSSIGVGYQLALRWGDAKPVYGQIAVIVRYTPSMGRPIASAPSVIAAR